MDALETARTVALNRANIAPEVQDAIDAKRKMLDAKASDLYVQLGPLAGSTVQIDGTRAIVDVSREPARVRLLAVALTRIVVDVDGDKSVRWKRQQNAEIVASWLAEGIPSGYAVKCRRGGAQSFSQIEDAVACIAEDVGRVLVLEA